MSLAVFQPQNGAWYKKARGKKQKKKTIAFYDQHEKNE